MTSLAHEVVHTLNCLFIMQVLVEAVSGEEDQSRQQHHNSGSPAGVVDAAGRREAQVGAV